MNDVDTALTTARPPTAADHGWAGSDRGRQVLDRVRAGTEDDLPAPAQQRRRAVLATAASVLGALLVVTAVTQVGTRGSTPEPVPSAGPATGPGLALPVIPLTLSEVPDGLLPPEHFFGHDALSTSWYYDRPQAAYFGVQLAVATTEDALFLVEADGTTVRTTTVTVDGVQAQLRNNTGASTEDINGNPTPYGFDGALTLTWLRAPGQWVALSVFGPGPLLNDTALLDLADHVVDVPVVVRQPFALTTVPPGWVVTGFLADAAGDYSTLTVGEPTVPGGDYPGSGPQVFINHPGTPDSEAGDSAGPETPVEVDGRPGWISTTSDGGRQVRLELPDGSSVDLRARGGVDDTTLLSVAAGVVTTP